MGNIVFTNTFANTPISNLATKLQQNFDNVLTVLNGNIGDSNFNSNSNLNINSLTSDSLITPSILNNDTAFDLSLSFGLSSPKKVKIINSTSTSLLEIDNSGNITIPLGNTNLYPLGTIIYFTGAFTNNATLPGWYKCDGTNGTVNLVNLFIRSSSTSGQTGGYADLTLGTHTHATTVGNSSATHTHTFSGTLNTANFDAHTHTQDIHPAAGPTANVNIGNYHDPSSFGSTSTSIGSTHTHTFSFTSDAETDTHIHTLTVDNAGVGEDGVGDNIPSYYKLIPIMRVS